MINNRKWWKRGFGLIFFIIVCIAGTGPVMAHRAIIFAWVEGGKIFTESKFSGGRPAKQGDIIVYDLEGNQLLKGKTDDQGEFSFVIPKKTAMKIVLQAGMGHRGEWLIPFKEIEDVAGAADPRKTASKKAEEQAEICDVTLDDIRHVVEEALDKRLNPVMKTLVESRESRPTFRDIFGGIGYILGLVGVAAYFNYRRKSAEIEGKETD